MIVEPRVLPCLLLSADKLVKTVQFASPRYVGDPVNVLNIFSSLEVDEIVLLDIDAPRHGTPPPFPLLEQLASECLVPLSYGGGIKSVEDAQRIIEVGLEKVVINSAVPTQPELVGEVAARFGSQAVIVSIDARRNSDGSYEVFTHGGSAAQGVDPATCAMQAQELGAGEILVTSIDRDGMMEGYDLELTALVTGAVDVPVIACGGAGARRQLADPIRHARASASAAGSLFVFQGPKRGVLINFPTRQELALLLS